MRRTHPADPAADDATPTGDALAAATAGLVYLSENEAPLLPVALPLPAGTDATTPLDADAIRAIAGAPAGATIESVTLAEFFAGQIEQADPADAAGRAAKPRFVALRDLIAARTVEPRAWRVRDDAAPGEVRCWVGGVARDDAGTFAGVSTIAYES